MFCHLKMNYVIMCNTWEPTTHTKYSRILCTLLNVYSAIPINGSTFSNTAKLYVLIHCYTVILKAMTNASYTNNFEQWITFKSYLQQIKSGLLTITVTPSLPPEKDFIDQIDYHQRSGFKIICRLCNAYHQAPPCPYYIEEL